MEKAKKDGYQKPVTTRAKQRIGSGKTIGPGTTVESMTNTQKFDAKRDLPETSRATNDNIHGP